VLCVRDQRREEESTTTSASSSTLAVVTAEDRRRLRRMIGSLRAALPVGRQPYAGYLRALDERLRRTKTIAADAVDRDVVTMNSTVHVRETDTGRCHALTLAYEADADPFGERVSVLAPLGAALLGSRVGDVVEWQTRRGPRRVRIERIQFQPEAAGKFDL
jgi:regulator of nucleoside diphosphate kinase